MEEHLIPTPSAPDTIPIMCGIDEAGRGSVFGPMVVAGVANPKGWMCTSVKDSKKFTSHSARMKVAEQIKANVQWAVLAVSADHIDQFGMAACIQMAVKNVRRSLIESLFSAGGFTRHVHVVMDGNGFEDFETPVPVTGGADVWTKFWCEPRADGTHFECSAASILAKTFHDDAILKMIEGNPKLARYGLYNNMGYGTAAHTQGILDHGTSPGHRKTFVKTLLRNHHAKNVPITPPEGILNEPNPTATA